MSEGVAVGDWKLDLIANELTFAGSHIATLPQQATETLELLMSRHGELVYRREFIEEIWGGDHLRGEKGLTGQIWLLRRVIKGKFPDGLIIKTLPRKGYRLIVRC